MIYITSSFSMNMFQDPSNLLLREQITEEQFYKEANKDGFSYIGAKDIARDLGFAYNKETIKARNEDVILHATLDHGEYRFYRITVMPTTVGCNKECEELL